MEIANFISDFENMPKKIQQQVINYFESLIMKNEKKDKTGKELKFDWQNGLAELNNKYTSVELQHQANELR